MLARNHVASIGRQIEKEKEKKKGNRGGAMGFGLGLAGFGTSANTSSASTALVPGSGPSTTSTNPLKAIISLHLDVNKAANQLSVELQAPIDLIILRSPVSLEIVESG
jgi:hypothetical protein